MSQASDRRVGVILGGWGEEREISVRTGEAIAQALEARGHPTTRIIAGPGLDLAVRGAHCDVAFLALHGRMGEDGKVQGLLEVMGVPYTGSGVLASAMAMHKPTAKRLFRQHNLATPVGYAVAAKDLQLLHDHLDLGFPCVVKPATGGSSIGAAVVHTVDQLEAAVVEACRYGGEALVERFVRGKEVTVAVLGDEVLGSLEVCHGASTFTYDAKYQGGAQYHCPPRLPPTRVANVEAIALAAYRALGCRGYGRVDLVCSDTANDVVLEVNTLPGMTPVSLFPKIANHAGVAFEDLIERILEQATLDAVEVQPVSASRLPQDAAGKASSRSAS